MKSHPLKELLISVQSGIACGKRDGEGVAQLRLNNILTTGNIEFKGHIRIPKNLVSPGLLLSPGDIIFTNTNSEELVGKSAWFNGHVEPITFSNHLTRLRTDTKRLDPEYLARWLQFLWSQKYFQEICDRWIGQAAVQKRKLVSLEIPLPLLREQRQIAARLKHISIYTQCAAWRINVCWTMPRSVRPMGIVLKQHWAVEVNYRSAKAILASSNMISD